MPGHCEGTAAFGEAIPAIRARPRPIFGLGAHVVAWCRLGGTTDELGCDNAPDFLHATAVAPGGRPHGAPVAGRFAGAAPAASPRRHGGSLCRLPQTAGISGVNLDASELAGDRLAKTLADLDAGGIRWVRFTLPWDRIEPARGQFDWNAWDAVFAELAAHPALEPVVVLDGSPAWARAAADDRQPPRAAARARGLRRVRRCGQPALRRAACATIRSGTSRTSRRTGAPAGRPGRLPGSAARGGRADSRRGCRTRRSCWPRWRRRPSPAAPT